jgi:hypothetical protein
MNPTMVMVGLTTDKTRLLRSFGKLMAGCARNDNKPPNIRLRRMKIRGLNIVAVHHRRINAGDG